MPLDVVARLKHVLEETLARAVPGATREVALIGFPNHGNVGDSAIWLAQLAFCRAHQLKIVYTCERRTYSSKDLGRRLGPSTTILLSGGGNFGDLFKGDQDLRERVLSDFPDAPTVQLPQTLHFKGHEATERAAGIVRKHRHLQLLVRDMPSLEFARQHFSAPVELCPDMAFYLGSQAVPGPPSKRELWLWRTDVEAPSDANLAWVDSSRDALVTDWLDEPVSVLKNWNLFLTRRLKSARLPGAYASLASATFEPLARRRFKRGCSLLSQGEVVVTNRLHGHILCLLMRIPHVVLDNNYGKVSGFVQAWGTLGEQVILRSTVHEARVEAARLERSA